MPIPDELSCAQPDTIYCTHCGKDHALTDWRHTLGVSCSKGLSSLTAAALSYLLGWSATLWLLYLVLPTLGGGYLAGITSFGALMTFFAWKEIQGYSVKPVHLLLMMLAGVAFQSASATIMGRPATPEAAMILAIVAPGVAFGVGAMSISLFLRKEATALEHPGPLVLACAAAWLGVLAIPVCLVGSGLYKGVRTWLRHNQHQPTENRGEFTAAMCILATLVALIQIQFVAYGQ